MTNGFDYFGITEAEGDAIMKRAEAGALTADDQVTIAAVIEAVNYALPEIAAAMEDVTMFFPLSVFGDVGELVPLFNEWLASMGVDARLSLGPTYRTEPRPDVALGGKPRNPEDDVLDAIDELVDWQLKKGQR